MRFLVLEHEPDAPPALLAEWTQARGHETDVVPAPRLRSSRPDTRVYDAVVSLGSEQSVHAQPPRWLERELQLLRGAHDAGVPILGICFGGQALAKALGAKVARAPSPHVEWRAIDSPEPGLISSGPWFFWHYDCFALPTGARGLARSRDQAVAFVCRRSLGLQFHPEVDEHLVQSWLSGNRGKLARDGVDLNRLDREIADHAPRARRRAFAQFDQIAAWWARPGGERTGR
jgi:GMP synthase-like glutamine amidotransferase